jgi:hypothetical protein
MKSSKAQVAQAFSIGDFDLGDIVRAHPDLWPAGTAAGVGEVIVVGHKNVLGIQFSGGIRFCAAESVIPVSTPLPATEQVSLVEVDEALDNFADELLGLAEGSD